MTDARHPLLLVALVACAAACGGGDGDPAGADTHPDVLDVTVTPVGERTYRFDVTMSSPYDTADRYADAWRVLGPDGTVYGVRELLHDHAAEQPFTRSLDGVEVPAGVEVVTVQGRDLEHGWGGGTVEVGLP